MTVKSRVTTLRVQAVSSLFLAIEGHLHPSRMTKIDAGREPETYRRTGKRSHTRLHHGSERPGDETSTMAPTLSGYASA